MILKKRYRRDLKHNMSLYISSTLLTVLSLLMFYLYYISGAGILDYTDETFSKQKIEDANFGTYLEIPNKDLEEYEEKYNIVLEKQRMVNIKTNDVYARIFDKTDKIDIPFVTLGKYPSKNDEIAISEGYAMENEVDIGDKIKVGSKNYKVSGYIERPDYLYMLQNLTDTDKNVNTFFISYVTEEEFEKLGNPSVIYLMRNENEVSTDEFRKDVNKNYIMSSYVKAEDNHRITMLTDQPVLFLQLAYAVLITLPLIAVVLISIILSRKIKSEQKLIGTLSAYGYTKKQIVMHYAGFSAIPGIVGGIITTIVVALCADAYGALGLMDYEPLKVDFKLDIPQMILGMIVPTVMYILSTALTVNHLLKHHITQLLSGSVKGKNHTRKMLVGKKVSFRTKFSVRSILGNKGRTFALFMGVFLGGYVMLWGFTSYDTMENMGPAIAESMGRYNHQYTLTEIKKDNPYGGETILAVGVEDEEANNVAVMGIDGNKLLDIKDKEGKDINVGDNYVATSLYSILSGVKAGDTITLENPLTLKEHKVKISEIVDNNFASAIYTSRANAGEIFGIDKSMYNMILSKDELNIPEEKIGTLLSKDRIDDQYIAIANEMNVIVYLFIGVGAFLCFVSVYIAANMIITENRNNISMLAVLGYDEKRINKLLIRDNIFVAIIGLLVSMPCAVESVRWLFSSFTDILGYYIEIHVNPSSYILTAILVLLSYIISISFAKRKIGKTDMVESLKDNRE